MDGSNRGALRRRLHDVFVDPALKFNDLHALLVEVAKNLLAVTTNYDTLLEEVFQRIATPYDLVVYPADSRDCQNGVLWWRHNPQVLVVPDYGSGDRAFLEWEHDRRSGSGAQLSTSLRSPSRPPLDKRRHS